MTVVRLAIAAALLCTIEIRPLGSETLEDVIRAANVPAGPFSKSELRQKIAGYGVSKGRPFLLAYYVDDGSGQLRPPLHVIRYDPGSKKLRRANFGEIKALFLDEIRMNCLGSALDISEFDGIVYIDTHYNPSAGCVIVLSSALELKTAISGWRLGVLGAEYAVIRRSEVHFMSVHPLHLTVYDVAGNRSTDIYPYKGDPQRLRYSKMIAPLISKDWCMKYNAQCDPENFDVDLQGLLAVNPSVRLFGFQAIFDAAGFGDTVPRAVHPQAVLYVFRERRAGWEHREYEAREFQQLFGSLNLEDLIRDSPDRLFESRQPH